jgi:hypothetical protein
METDTFPFLRIWNPRFGASTGNHFGRDKNRRDFSEKARIKFIKKSASSKALKQPADT